MSIDLDVLAVICVVVQNENKNVASRFCVVCKCRCDKCFIVTLISVL